MQNFFVERLSSGILSSVSYYRLSVIHPVSYPHCVHVLINERQRSGRRGSRPEWVAISFDEPHTEILSNHEVKPKQVERRRVPFKDR